ncbi:MAG: hypothetical protein ACTSU5_04785 [Promethearchaeota archaeon]
MGEGSPLARWKSRVSPFWEALYEYNMNQDSEEALEEFSGKTVEVPFLGVKAPVSSVSKLLQFFGPRLLNENLNSLKVVLGDNGKSVESIDLVLEDGHGNFIKGIPVDEELLGTIPAEWEDLEANYDTLKTQLNESMGVEIGFIAVYHKEFYKGLMDTIVTGDEKRTIPALVKGMARLLEEVFKNGWFRYFPRLKIVDFVERLTGYYGADAITNLLSISAGNLPDFNMPLTIYDESWVVGLNFTKMGKKFEVEFIPDQAFDGLDLNRFRSIPKWVRKKNVHRMGGGGIKTWSVCVKNGVITDLLGDLADSKIPLTPERGNLLLSKLLFTYSRFEKDWNISPYPTSQHPLVRMFMRGLGFNFNIKKVAYWSFPEIASELFGFFLGRQGRMALIFTDGDQKAPLAGFKGYFLEYQSGTFRNLERLPEMFLEKVKLPVGEFKAKGYSSYAAQVFKHLNAVGHCINRVAIVKRNLVKRLLKNVIFDINSSRPIRLFKLLGTVKRIKNKKQFALYPTSPLYLSIQSTGSTSLVKNFLNLLVDIHEF